MSGRFFIGKVMYRFFNGKFWRKLVFCLLINLGLPATFGFYSMTEVPLRTRLGFVLVMALLGIFEASVMWLDLSPAPKQEDEPGGGPPDIQSDEECTCENCFCKWMSLTSAEFAETP